MVTDFPGSEALLRQLLDDFRKIAHLDGERAKPFFSELFEGQGDELVFDEFNGRSLPEWNAHFATWECFVDTVMSPGTQADQRRDEELRILRVAEGLWRRLGSYYQPRPWGNPEPVPGWHHLGMEIESRIKELEAGTLTASR